MPVLQLKGGLTLYFSRHGETVANVEKRFQGRTRDTALTPLGVTQANAIAGILRADVPDCAALAYVASSLPRACKTMEIIRGDLGLPVSGYTTDARLMEIDLGEWDGLTDDQARALDPAKFAARGADKWEVRVPGGENYADVARRAENWVASLNEDTFAVSHGAFTRILRGLFLGLGWKAMSDLDEQQGVVFRVRGSVVERLEAN